MKKQLDINTISPKIMKRAFHRRALKRSLNSIPLFVMIGLAAEALLIQGSFVGGLLRAQLFGAIATFAWYSFNRFYWGPRLIKRYVPMVDAEAS